jgi:hypothetical protein
MTDEWSDRYGLHPDHQWVRLRDFLCWNTLTTEWGCTCTWRCYTYDNAPAVAGWRGAYQSPELVTR